MGACVITCKASHLYGSAHREPSLLGFPKSHFILSFAIDSRGCCLLTILQGFIVYKYTPSLRLVNHTSKKTGNCICLVWVANWCGRGSGRWCRCCQQRCHWGQRPVSISTVILTYIFDSQQRCHCGQESVNISTVILTYIIDCQQRCHWGQRPVSISRVIFNFHY
jgi:hypothetical protein